MEIQSMLLTPNPYSRPQTPLKTVRGVVVHYVGNKGSTAKGNRNYFESLKDEKKDDKGNTIFASSNYIVGLEGEIIQCVPETEIAYCSNRRNLDTLSIECCHPLADGKFTDATYKSLTELAADICVRYGLDPKNDIIRHYDVTKKACPLFHVNNTDAWENLKSDVRTVIKGGRLPAKGFVNINYLGLTAEIRADNIEGFYIAKLSELARLFGEVKIPVRYVLESDKCELLWDDTTKTITALKKTSVTEKESEILNRIVQAEAGGEDETGKILVANVILNRTRAKGFPDSIEDVVFQNKTENEVTVYQFSPIGDKRYFDAEPTESVKNAVNKALGGIDRSRGATFFCSVSSAKNPENWHEKALTFLFEHGGHRFYC